MKKFSLIVIPLIFPLIFMSTSCKKEPSDKSQRVAPPPAGTEVDTEKIVSKLGFPFRILKTETVGLMPLHKFFWISVKDDANEENVKNLADEVIKDTISKRPATYHSFTIHFFKEKEIIQTVEQSKRFALAEFLPDGGWIKAGRVPIENYDNYKLTCTFFE